MATQKEKKVVKATKSKTTTKCSKEAKLRRQLVAANMMRAYILGVAQELEADARDLDLEFPKLRAKKLREIAAEYMKAK